MTCGRYQFRQGPSLQTFRRPPGIGIGSMPEARPELSWADGEPLRQDSRGNGRPEGHTGREETVSSPVLRPAWAYLETCLTLVVLGT